MKSSTTRKRRKPRGQPKNIFGVASGPVVVGLAILVAFALFFSFVLGGAIHSDAAPAAGAAIVPVPVAGVEQAVNIRGAAAPIKLHEARTRMTHDLGSDRDLPHVFPRLPHLPPFAPIANAEKLAQDTLDGSNPTIAGVAAVINNFLGVLHEENIKNSKAKADIPVLQESYFRLAKEYLRPFDAAYRNKPIFPVREDDSVFISLAAFREHLLGQTLRSAFSEAKHPEKLYVGAIIQNCFGMNGIQCKTGLQVIGKNEQGRDMTKISDAPPDANGIEEFCTDPQFKQYCDAGQVRVIYQHDTDALGPAIARYYASKLWGGETFFMQMDAHLEFATGWDQKYIAEAKAANSFPKVVLSAYPPGFTNFGTFKGGTPGARLCVCEFSSSQAENKIIRINAGENTKKDTPRPTQIAFIAAGFFFARAEFLTDVPFDPFLPWCFMGEEIALSMRAWTQGWDIYAPRQNLIAHQYRPVECHCYYIVLLFVSY
jgi:[Skp1-protein]-hydroxyproline N-acetylglucosaminyltransferase